MADSDFDLLAHVEQLNTFQGQLLSVAQVSAYLLDLVVDMPVPEWQKSACFLMRDQLLATAEAVPFPSFSAQQAAKGVSL